MKNRIDENHKIISLSDCAVGFECVICGNSESFDAMSNRAVFPVCSKCLSDLKDIIIEKRKTHLSNPLRYAPNACPGGTPHTWVYANSDETGSIYKCDKNKCKYTHSP